MTAALTARVLGHLPYWNWRGFTAGYTPAQFFDLITGWFSDDLAIAKIAQAQA